MFILEKKMGSKSIIDYLLSIEACLSSKHIYRTNYSTWIKEKYERNKQQWNYVNIVKQI